MVTSTFTLQFVFLYTIAIHTNDARFFVYTSMTSSGVQRCRKRQLMIFVELEFHFKSKLLRGVKYQQLAVAKKLHRYPLEAVRLVILGGKVANIQSAHGYQA